MNVKLISLTQSMILDDDGKPFTPEGLLVYIARVSNPENQMNTATADRLIAYLISHKHWSPFDMANLCVEVKTSRVIAHQILRHWSIKPQEFSQRYSEATEFEPIELRKKAEKNRQSSEEPFDFDLEIPTGIMIQSRPYLEGDNEITDEEEIFKRGKASELVAQHVKASEILYKALLANGVAKECARFVLPLSTSTTMYLNGSIRSWIHYLEQRTSQHAQKEHRLVAFEIESLFEKVFPNVVKAVKLLSADGK